jgi:uncharacterized membrane protein YtjA (UPF0391 family)
MLPPVGLHDTPSIATLECVANKFQQEHVMLHYAVVFLVVALIAAVFGFGGIAAGAVEIAKILFFIFAFMAIVTFLVSLVRKN